MLFHNDVVYIFERFRNGMEMESGLGIVILNKSLRVHLLKVLFFGYPFATMFCFIDEELTIFFSKEFEVVDLFDWFSDNFFDISLKQQRVDELWVIFKYLWVAGRVSRANSLTNNAN